ncbi:MAG: respiratory nitrate reductase subunit gamma [Pseudomonadota bacterium]|nr:respiratory nitrate reductase subunit gamma [Pseudomonadota bacterium]MDP1905939.1 respiratory nitrate reductase subunit gamma [Pseudomonadota bacterium]MDP2353822.1 respiratory nitrate reductase subunit gamma [Pseudomonadota bacterium]
MDLHQLVFGVYPYICLVTFVLGSWIRFDHEQYTWKSDSSQLLSKSGLRMFSNFFHIGIIAIFFGHFVGLLTPHSVFLALGVSDMAHQGIAILAGGLFGTLALVGGLGLWLRRLFNKRVRAASRWMDINILGWILLTLVMGMATLPFSIGHAEHGDATVMLRLADWVQSVVTLQPNPELLRGVDTVFKMHIFLGMSVFLFFPFTRLVHIWSAPFGYLFRAYQIVRSKRPV